MRIILLFLVCLSLTGCGMDSDTHKLWNGVKLGEKYLFLIRDSRTQEKRYFRIQRITEKEFTSHREKK